METKDNLLTDQIPMMDTKDANRFDRRSEVPIKQGKDVKDICPWNVSTYFTSV
jgi:hypothetical protein